MAVNLQPAFDVLPAYRPVKFELVQTAPNPLIIENAVVTILKNGVPIGPPIRFKSSRQEISIIPASTDFFFEVDIQKYVQDDLGPTAELPSTIFLSTFFGSALNSEMFGAFQISASYEFISTITGLLVPLVAPLDISNQFNVYSIARQCTSPFFEDMDLEQYVGIPLANPETLFLTKGARTIELCEDENAFLSIIQPNAAVAVNSFQVELYDVNDVLLSSGVAVNSIPPFSSMQTLNTSVDSLTFQIYVLGAPNFADPNLSYYTVSMGYAFNIPPFIYLRQSEVVRYNISKACCDLRSCRLHWMNLLGGTDSYTFNSEKAISLKTESSQAEKALSWEIGSATPHNASDVGRFKIKSEATPSISLKSKILTNTEATWLSELLTSPKVYAFIEGEFVPVIITDTEQIISRHTGKIRYEVTAQLANDWIIQRI